ncbi:helix-turn-helix domain-containing protein [Listeria ivanovii]|uniref:helix-turn-helix domain-containing protein n=1 Tax=Listeria ivanovii TaxID=1638 RepID=UPI0003EC8C0B|nr:helix-turn-helix transcriptional regulator [Listeria ivanovii]AHI55592.1 AraC family transcriptional regulator [Listeria ivanovii WSLC3009]AIS65047.1 AraC family transcriptional regulator [Listeria ivanovii subsp. ivanovii]MBC1758236.1 helix-turn-helix transcriptional regulator [Listeria ivanovii]MBK3913113.1 helix-turn-helix transcriptional regulator [Listeria ivanovii subsp. ivanovii]MBK3920770.1 helix-turn-helix transcriptional regulator [Listeria ivanovii subsp. ivanovii]
MKTKMTEILSFISEEAVSRKMTSEEIAVHFGYDKHHFSRKFKEINGFSVVELLSSLKVEKAIIKLDEDKRVIDLQEHSGFESSGSFTNTFKKYTGSSPKKYMNEMSEIFFDVKSFEKDDKDKSIAHFEEKNHSFCTVNIEVPDGFEKGIIFIGIFRTLIPNHMPISGLASKNLIGNKLKNIPSGDYYLLACAISCSNNILSYFNLGNSLRGKEDGRLSFPKCSGNSYTIKLREPIPEDPPILVNVGKLLISYLKNTI